MNIEVQQNRVIQSKPIQVQGANKFFIMSISVRTPYAKIRDLGRKTMKVRVLGDLLKGHPNGYQPYMGLRRAIQTGLKTH